jgi:hypothetical protein
VDAEDQEGRSPDLHVSLVDLLGRLHARSAMGWGKEAPSMLDTKRCRGKGLDFWEGARYM